MAGPAPSGGVWRRSSRCHNADTCVEVADRIGAVAVRDSKDLDGPILEFSRSDWLAFVAHVRTGRFDLRPDGR